MPLRILPNEEMIAITAPWVDPAHGAHQVLLGRPLTAAMISEITGAHNDVQDATNALLSSRLSALQNEQKSLDVRHDDLYRSVFYRLLSEEYRASDPDQADEFRSLRHLFAPDGLSLVNRSYRHEAGHAQVVENQLTTEQRQLLTNLTTASGTLLDTVQEYFALARQLGTLDHERRSLNEPTTNGRSQNAAARRRWIRVVNMIRMAGDVLGEQDSELTALLIAVERAERQAEERRRRASGNDPADAPADDLADDLADDRDDAPDDAPADALADAAADDQPATSDDAEAEATAAIA